ncbi:hypothetical protein AOCH_005630, partial [Aspergillus ochraceoroseus]
MKLLVLLFFISLAVSDILHPWTSASGISDALEARDNDHDSTVRAIDFIPMDCFTDDDCKSNPKGHVCVSHICVRSRPVLTETLHPESRDPTDPNCHNDRDCQGGYCYNGICIADPPPVMRFARRSPADPNCHNDRDCQGGYCYRGICIADPPPPQFETRAPTDPNCHNDRDCQGGYCYNGICIADPPP